MSIPRNPRPLPWAPLLPLVAAALFIGCSAESKKAHTLERADQYFDTGNYDAAKIEYFNVLKESPQNARALGRIGIIWFEQGSPTQALRFLRPAAELRPDAVDVRIRLGRIFGEMGQFKEARAEAEATLTLVPGHSEAILLLADIARSTEEIQQTRLLFQELVGKGSESAEVHLGLATLAMKQKDVATVDAEVTAALRCDPSSAVAHVALGRLLASKGQWEEAAKAFQTAGKLSPPRSPAQLAYPSFMLSRGNLAEVRTALESLVKAAPDSLNARLMLAKVAAQQGASADALDALKQLFSRDPSHFLGRIVESEIQMATGENEKALEGTKLLIQTYPDSPLAQFTLAKAHLANGSPSQAIVALEQTVALQPDYLDAVLLLSQLRLRSGDPESVVSVMENILLSHPESLSAQFLLAEAYRSLDRLDDAAATVKRQIETGTEDFRSYLAYGMILRQQNKNTEAREAFQRAQSLMPETPVPVYQLAELDLAEKQYDAALARLESERNRNPASAATCYMLGKVYAEQKDWDKAEGQLLEAIKLDPNFLHAYDLLLNGYVEAGKLPEALARVEDFVAKNPDNAGALLQLAQMQNRVGDGASARDTYEKVLALKPDAAVAANNLAWLYSEAFNNPERAYELAQRARDLLPDNGAVADTLGWIIYKQQDYPRALALLREAAAKAPDDAGMQYRLGIAAYAMGETAQAQTAFAKAVSSETDFPEKEDARKHLTLLGDGATETQAQVDDASVADLQAIVKDRPNDPVILMRFAAALENESRFAEAAAACRQALTANPNLVAPMVKLAQLSFERLEDGAAALQFAENARRLQPDDPEIAGLLGRIELARGDLQRAHVLLREGTRQASPTADVLYDCAWAAYRLGSVPAARQEMQRFLDVATEDSGRSQLASDFLNLTKVPEILPPPPETVASAEKILATDPGFLPALMIEASAKAGRGDNTSAIAAYESILQQHPEFAPAQKSLAALLARDPKTLETARELALKAREKLPDDPELAATVAEISFHQSEFAYAIQLLRPLDASPAGLSARHLYFLGMSEIQTKESEKGKTTLRRALTAGLSGKLADSARAALK
ncbi:MAG: tetratricopeptide repeat protein [Verrucomicrobiales bacterium]